nr:hypothetical protein CFP56_31322 [Quercus suber]
MQSSVPRKSYPSYASSKASIGPMPIFAPDYTLSMKVDLDLMATDEIHEDVSMRASGPSMSISHLYSASDPTYDTAPSCTSLTGANPISTHGCPPCNEQDATITPPPPMHSLLPTPQEPIFFNPTTQHNWAILFCKRLRPIGNHLLHWIQSYPTLLWSFIEEEMERTLRSQAHTLPMNTLLGKVIIPIFKDLAFISPVISLSRTNPTHWIPSPRAHP